MPKCILVFRMFKNRDLLYALPVLLCIILRCLFMLPVALPPWQMLRLQSLHWARVEDTRVKYIQIQLRRWKPDLGVCVALSVDTSVSKYRDSVRRFVYYTKREEVNSLDKHTNNSSPQILNNVSQWNKYKFSYNNQTKPIETYQSFFFTYIQIYCIL